jgi:hypothetical protein
MATMAQQFWREILDGREPADPPAPRANPRPKSQARRIRIRRVRPGVRRTW